MWIAKSTVASIDSASFKAKTVLNYKTLFAPQLRLSRGVKDKAPCAYIEVTAAPLASTTLLGSVKPAAREAKTRAPCVLAASLIYCRSQHQVLKNSATRLEVKHC